MFSTRQCYCFSDTPTLKKYLLVLVILLAQTGVSWAAMTGDKFVAPFQRSDGQYGFVNENHCWVIEPQFDDAGSFSDGLADVKIGGKWGFIDRTGKMVINPQFEELPIFWQDGLAAVKIGEKYGFIDRTGKLVINPQFDYAWRFSDGLAAVMMDRKLGFIDRTGKIIINPQFEDAWWFSDGLAAVKIGGKWGFIDPSGKLVINPQFAVVGFIFSHDLAQVQFQAGKKWFQINRKGEVLLDPTCSVRP